MDQVTDQVGCESFKYALARQFLVQHEVSSFQFTGKMSRQPGVREQYYQSFRGNSRFKEMSDRDLIVISEATEEIQARVGSYLSSDPDEARVFLRQWGLGDQSTEALQKASADTLPYEVKIQKVIRQNQIECSTPENPPLENPDPDPNQPLSLLEQSMRTVFATSYQSCSVLDLPALRVSDDPIRGVVIKGLHPDNIGSKRFVENLTELQKSHPYIRNQTYPEACFSVKKNPLIYDYGGRPFANDDDHAALNFFKNSGSGTTVLGYDCSAFVYSVLLKAGLKMNSKTPFRARDVEAANSRHFISPAQNGFNCLDRITLQPQQNLFVGDIAAIAGHVLMIYRVGQDPFGIASKITEKECSEISVSKFDFDIVQSSALKNGIGLNIISGADYMLENEDMKKGFTAYAQQACLAKIKGTSQKPVVKNFSIVRHKQTSECKTTPVPLEKSECVKSCTNFAVH